jgi:hypothetical protein
MPLILSGNTGTSTLDSSNGLTFSDASLQGAAASPYVLKNRIINGAMVVDQRNAGASVTITSTINITYTLDRYYGYGSAASKFSVQQDAGAVTPPVGFNDYLGCTSLSAYSISSSDIFFVGQRIEGFNTADLGWGTASARTVTLSFWVRSSLTGTFGGVLTNSSRNRSYPFTYTISAANTWEQKTVTIAGDTTGTWLTTNGVGIELLFGLGVGSTGSGTAGAWAGSTFYSATGATSVVGTNGATFYITGVQLEQNTSATPFERRLYGQELINCQRYYESYTLPANYNAIPFQVFNSNSGQGSLNFKVTKRASPSSSVSQVGTLLTTIANGSPATGNVTLGYGALSVDAVCFTAAVTSGLVAGNISYIYSTAGATLAFNSEL